MIYNTDYKVIKRYVAKELKVHQFKDDMLENVYGAAYLQGWREAEAWYRDIQSRAAKTISDLEARK